MGASSLRLARLLRGGSMRWVCLLLGGCVFYEVGASSMRLARLLRGGCVFYEVGASSMSLTRFLCVGASSVRLERLL